MSRHVELDALEVARHRAKAPRTAAMETRFFEALTSWPRHHRIENALLTLGYQLDAGHDLTDDEEAHFEQILAAVEEAASAGSVA